MKTLALSLTALCLATACFDVDGPVTGTAVTTDSADTADPGTPPVHGGDGTIDDCAADFPADTVLVSGGSQVIQDGQAAWVCSGATLQVQGNDALIFAEPGATVTVNGNDHTVYGDDNATVSLWGNENVVYTVDRNAVSDVGNDNVVVSCDELAITGGPARSCS